MRFNKEHKVIIQSMDACEASAFVAFLRSEVLRHFAVSKEHTLPVSVAMLDKILSKARQRAEEARLELKSKVEKLERAQTDFICKAMAKQVREGKAKGRVLK